MKKIGLLLLTCMALACISAFAEDSEDGDPVLPQDSLATVLDLNATDVVMANDLRRLAKIHWQPAPEKNLLEDAIDIPAFSASLLCEPATQALANGPAPRDCADVRRERRTVHRQIARVRELRELIEARLDRATRVCSPRTSSACDTHALDAPLAELNQIISQLRAYAEREAASTADRWVVYRFHLDGAAGLASLRQGWRPVGAGEVSRVRFPHGPWRSGPTLDFSAEGALATPPLPQANGTWVVSRLLTATHACATASVFNLEFRSGWQKAPSFYSDISGTVLADPALPLESVLIKAIAL